MTAQRSPAADLKTRNRRLALGAAGLVATFAGLAALSVPAYRLFCAVTGYGGTPRVAAAGQAPEAAAPGAGSITVRFDASTDGRMPWRFTADQTRATVPLGQPVLASFTARNPTAGPVSGTATFNVTPLKAAQYVTKYECFCFTEQTLAPGQEVHMPVSFVIDPAIARDPGVRDVTTLTLAYTFFRVAGDGKPQEQAAATPVPGAGSRE